MIKSLAIDWTIALAVLVFALLPIQAWADKSNFSITDGLGEDMVVRHGCSGLGSETSYHDRLGNKYMKKEGLLNKETEVNVLGNRYQKKSQLGTTTLTASDIFGDRITSHQTSHGHRQRQTDVNLSGAASIVQSIFSHKATPPGQTGLIDPSNFQTFSTAGKSNVVPSDLVPAGVVPSSEHAAIGSDSNLGGINQNSSLAPVTPFEKTK